MRYILSPSLLAADIGHLAEEVKTVEKAGAQYLHLDVMDGRPACDRVPAQTDLSHL